VGRVRPGDDPAGDVTQLADLFGKALKAPEIKAKLATLGFLPVDLCGAPFADYIRRQYDEYGRIIREANIKE
jgi:tripartite-type tricarboxylate transporter receptor subunit TctC